MVRQGHIFLSFKFKTSSKFSVLDLHNSWKVLILQLYMGTRHEILNQIVYVGKQYIPQGGRLLLYGSQARGTATDSSDWDLLIILDKPKIEKSDYDNVSFPFTALGWDIGQMISPVLYTKDEWNNNSFTPFYKNIQQDAIYLI